MARPGSPAHTALRRFVRNVVGITVHGSVIAPAVDWHYQRDRLAGPVRQPWWQWRRLVTGLGARR